VSVAIPVSARGAGSATITASANGGQASATVNVKAEAQVYYIHPDHLGTPRFIADETQKIVWRWDQQEPFGATPPNDDPDADGVKFDFPLRFPGQYFDRETNLAYNVMRDYDTGIGRYVQSDPIGLDGGLNTYSYVGNNPISYADPDGLTTCDGKWRFLRWNPADHRDPASLLSRPGRPYGSQCWCYWTCDRCDGSPGSEEKTLGTMFINPRLLQRYPNDCRCENPGPESRCQCRG
jgi:RHS repeat-associated protein